MKPSLEKIIALKPDLVIMSAFTGEELNNGLKSNNIEAKRVQANSIEEIFTNFLEVAKMLGKENEANKIIAEKKSKAGRN
jgi:putative hemin ABC transporter, periplasmic hemin-binding protein